MKIVISSSASQQDHIAKQKALFEAKGYEVLNYPKGITVSLLEEYPQLHTHFYESITETEVLFVLNAEKHGIPGYIGPAVFAEIAFAIGLNLVYEKKIQIHLLNAFPESSPFRDELMLWEQLGWIVVGSDFS